MSQTALIVVDVQESFRHRPYYDAADVAAFLAAQNALIAGFASRALPIVRVFHVEDEGAFALASGLVRPLDGLDDFRPALTLHKHAHSAFAGTALASWLTARGIGRIAVSGIRSEQCCETTTRDGSDRGFAVDYVTEATLTFAMTHASGRRYTPAEIKERCELVLADRFATITDVAGALRRADASRATREQAVAA
jgi:nicotinamidase-related amidase